MKIGLQTKVLIAIILLLVVAVVFHTVTRDSQQDAGSSPTVSSETNEQQQEDGESSAGSDTDQMRSTSTGPVVVIDSARIPVEIADSATERIRGLSNREYLPEQSGLLFIFDEVGEHGIWMKDMNFAIDIIWIGENNRVVDRQIDVSPDTYPTVFTPQADARYVLEVNAGFAETANIKIGDFVKIENYDTE